MRTWPRRLATSSMMSHDYDVILVTSQYSKSSNSETYRTRINYTCGHFKQTLKQNIVLKHERIWITVAREEGFHAMTKARRSVIKAFNYRTASFCDGVKCFLSGSCYPNAF